MEAQQQVVNYNHPLHSPVASMRRPAKQQEVHFASRTMVQQQQVVHTN
jgi:hypothetical protein